MKIAWIPIEMTRLQKFADTTVNVTAPLHNSQHRERLRAEAVSQKRWRSVGSKQDKKNLSAFHIALDPLILNQWFSRSTFLQSLAVTHLPILVILKTLIILFRGVWLKLDLNFAGEWTSRVGVANPCYKPLTHKMEVPIVFSFLFWCMSEMASWTWEM